MQQSNRKLIRFARITATGTDEGHVATQQMEYLGKVADGLIVFPYGLHGNVPADALALMMSVGGDPDNRAAIAWTAKDRPKLEPGEVAFYHAPTDAVMIWRTGGHMEITTGEQGQGNVTINCSQANINASDSVNIDSPISNIGAGGNNIARLGDEVEVTVTGGSSAGTYTGTITSAGTNTSI
jgi:phage gp45-like